MRGLRNSAIIGALAFLAASGFFKSSDSALASKIERRVIAAHPDFDFARYARFYSRDNTGFVSGIYLFANEGYEPYYGKTGHSYWVSQSDLPVIDDGGCSVINVTYNSLTKTLISFTCNGDA
jgi:hypothetical protein